MRRVDERDEEIPEVSDVNVTLSSQSSASKRKVLPISTHKREQEGKQKGEDLCLID